MNKKVSTVLTCGLILGGSLLCSSAFADQISSLVTAANSVEAGSQYVLMQTVSGGNQVVYGLEKQSDGTIKEVVVPFGTNIDNDDLANYAWTISEDSTLVAGGTPSKRFYYSFHNVGLNVDLRVNAIIDDIVTSGSTAGTFTDFAFQGYSKYDGTQTSSMAVIDGVSDNEYIGFADATDDMIFGSGHSTKAIKFYKIESQQVGGSALNTLYNSKGFSFAINVPNNSTVVENIFQDLRAIDVTADVVNAREDGTRWGFPEGTYFVTKASYDEVKAELGTEYSAISSSDADKQLEFLRKLTFIAVSSTQSVELSGIDRENGQGFEFVQISGDDLYDYIGTDLDKLPQNDQVSVYNACFHVEGLATNSYPYSLRLENFYYIDDADAYAAATDGDYDQTKKSVNIEVLKHGSPASYYLTTSAGTTNAAPFIFKFDESNVVSGISFLKTTDAPAVYNIRFVSGASDATERGKYLTLGDTNNATGFEWLAKGEALADAEALATPAYQFVITSVSGNDVVFTNRETGQEFSAKLFDEGEQNGRTVYSLAATTTSDNKTIEVVNIKSNSYGTTLGTPVSLNDVEIQLIESEVDPYAGFLNVEETELQTIKFARDANTTSNLWYAAVDANDDMYTGGTALEAVLSDDLYSAAQWKFEEVEELDLSRDYAYNNNNVVAIKGYGDVLKAKVYKIEYITDGTETGKYLAANNANGGISINTTGDEFIVKTYPDGSVKLIKNAASYVLFQDDANALHSNTKSEGDLALNSNNRWAFDENLVYDAIREDNDMLMFMVNESPEISWPGEEGHVTIQSAGGDYLTIDTDNNDAIIIDEANADPFYLHVTDKNAVVPSFYISKGIGEGSTAESERMFLFNPQDSITYQVNMDYDPKYQMSEETVKAVFKSGIMDESRDTLALTVKGEVDKLVAMQSNNQQNVWGGLNRFKFQIIESEELTGLYNIRQIKAGRTDVNGISTDNSTTYYLANINDNAVWVTKDNKSVPRYEFAIESIEAPTANESVSATEVKVVAYDGAINIKNAAGKNVVVSTILGQIVANEVLTSDNATIAVPAGIAIVSVDGEEAVKVSVK